LVGYAQQPRADEPDYRHHPRRRAAAGWYLFRTEPTSRTFDVHTSSGLKIVAGKAA
jgi:hypothetical protein